VKRRPRRAGGEKAVPRLHHGSKNHEVKGGRPVNITEIRVKLVSDNAERLKAFCSITLDGAFVIRDLKVIDGATGPFVAMPSRKLADRCPKCGSKNHLRARFCGDCGVRLKDDRAPRDAQGRVKLHADVAHPINAACRELIQQAVVEAYREEIEASQRPDYEPQTYEDEDVGVTDYDEFMSELKESAARRSAARADRGRREKLPREADARDQASDEPDAQEVKSKPAKDVMKGQPGTAPPAREEFAAGGTIAPPSDSFASGIL
jgi:stage V sporulation protein G